MIKRFVKIRLKLTFSSVPVQDLHLRLNRALRSTGAKSFRGCNQERQRSIAPSDFPHDCFPSPPPGKANKYNSIREILSKLRLCVCAANNIFRQKGVSDGALCENNKETSSQVGFADCVFICME